jgi:murein DD-endopeptidase MepM/ murein hydrolase activator NlpD
MAYLYHRELQRVHEFQVDYLLTSGIINKAEYLQLIWQQLSTARKPTGVCHYFNGSILKSRINMLTMKRSKKKQALKYLLAIPVVAAIGLSFNAFTQQEVAQAVQPDRFPNKAFAFADLGNNEPSIMVPSISPINKESIERITSKFGMRIHPVTKEERMHLGMDFLAKEGVAVKATANGIVIGAKFEEKYGNLIKIDHGGGVHTWYAHLKGFKVEVGDYVTMNQTIGYVGNTGLSYNAHLHYEVHKDGKRVNPEPYIAEGC